MYGNPLPLDFASSLMCSLHFKFFCTFSNLEEQSRFISVVLSDSKLEVFATFFSRITMYHY